MQGAVNFVHKAYPEVAHLTDWKAFYEMYPTLKI